MITYENSYLKIKTDFPLAWRVRREENPNAKSKSQARYQLADDDLPTEDDDYRTLFFASRNIGRGSSFFSSKFSMIAHKHIDGYDLSREVKQKVNLLECKFDQSRILDREVSVLKYMERADNYNSVTKIVAWEEIPEIWLSIYIGGDSLENFLVAEGLLNNLRRIKN